LIAFSAIDDPLYRWFDVPSQGRLVVPLNVFDILVALGVYLAIYIRKRFVDGAHMARRDWLLVALAGSLVSILFAIVDSFPAMRGIAPGQPAQSQWFTVAYRAIDELGRFVLLFVMAWQLKPETANRAVGRRSLRTTVVAVAAAALLGLALFLLVILVDSRGELASHRVTPYRLFGILFNSVPRGINTGVILFASLVGFQLGLRIAFSERFPGPSREAIGKKRMIRRGLVIAGVIGVMLLGASQLNERNVRPSRLYCAITSPGDTSAVLLNQRQLMSAPGWDASPAASEPLPAGACLAVLGRDESGQWLYVRGREQSGWLYNDTGIDWLITPAKVPIIQPRD
jgi:hypothetical protein